MLMLFEGPYEGQKLLKNKYWTKLEISIYDYVKFHLKFEKNTQKIPQVFDQKPLKNNN
jgi:hypothetical protein